jgi:hypothetical protein
MDWQETVRHGEATTFQQLPRVVTLVNTRRYNSEGVFCTTPDIAAITLPAKLPRRRQNIRNTA